MVAPEAALVDERLCALGRPALLCAATRRHRGGMNGAPDSGAAAGAMAGTDAFADGGRGGRPRVVVVGAGLAGLTVVHTLRNAPVDLILVDSCNYTTFPPLLFQAAVGLISPEDVVSPTRAALGGGVTFRVGTVVGIDWARSRVLLEDDEVISFDYLVLCPGVVASFGGVPGAAAYAIPLKSVTDAVRLRNSVLRSFEAAAADRERIAGGATSVAIIGGGSTGVELAGYLRDLFRYSFVSDYPDIDPAAMQITIVEQGDRLLPAFHPGLSGYVYRTLVRRGVHVRLATGVSEVGPGGVRLRTGEWLPARTVVWAGGVTAPAWVAASGLKIIGGRVVVGADLGPAHHRDTFVVGDLAAVATPDGRALPQVAQLAIQSARHTGRQITGLLAGETPRPFRYHDKGSMAVVGRNAAVVQTRHLHLTGRPAWAAWGALHLAYLRGGANRLSLAQKWRWWHVTHKNTTRVLIELPGPERAAPAGAVAPQRES